MRVLTYRVLDLIGLQSFCLRPPRCVSTGPVVVRLAGMANERKRERDWTLDFSLSPVVFTRGS